MTNGRVSACNVVGKMFACVIQERLQQLAEEILPDSQCGLRKRRECTDMIFAAEQLVEKCCEHDDCLFTLFIDLRKIYNSVPRPALWSVLEKCDVSPTMMSVIKSFHDDMQAEVRVGDTTTERITVQNGLLQGCTSLFNIYFCGMMAYWGVECPEGVVMVRINMAESLLET